MKASSLTDVGQRRKLNEDSIYCSTQSEGNLNNLFILADGMGGHKAGEIASATAIEQFLLSVREDEGSDPIAIFKTAIQAANSVLYEKSQTSDRLRGMGTTFVACSLKEETLFVANVGDSRLYLVGESIRQITKDHSLVEELVNKGDLDRTSPEYKLHKNVITRAVGSLPGVEADFFEVEIKKDDRILLCSDGLTNMVDDENIFRIINETQNLDECVKNLVDLANSNGGIDNISVIIVSPKGD